MAVKTAPAPAGPPTQDGRPSAKAPTGSPSTGLKRDHSSGNAMTESSEKNGTPSTQERVVMKSNSDTNGNTSASQETRLQKQKQKRQKWTKDEQLELYRCYCEAISLNLKQIKGTFDVWQKKHPNERPNLTPTTLANQRRYAEANVLTENEKREIKETFHPPPPPTTPPRHTPSTPATAVITHPPTPTTVETDNTPVNTTGNNPEGPLTEEMAKMEEEFLTRLKYTIETNMEDRRRPKKYKMTKKNKTRLGIMNNVIDKYSRDVPIADITHLNAVHYAAAITLTGEMPSRSKEKIPHDPDKYIEENIEKTRKWVGRLTAALKSKKLTPKLRDLIKNDDVETALQKKKMRLAALCKKKRTRVAARKRKASNLKFSNTPKKYYSSLRSGNQKPIDNPPTGEKVRKFWSGIYEDEREHNKEAAWISDEKLMMSEITEPKWEKITEETISLICRRLANWKAPGKDQVQNFWIKKLTALHPTLAKMMESIVQNPAITPQWMTEGRTTLIHKTGSTNIPKNYRPITCLPTYWKLLTLIFTDQIYTHVVENNILPLEQKGIRRKAKGCKDQLLLDKAVTEDAKKKKKNLSLMWIDYKKAYDSVPHSWIQELMKIYKFNSNIMNFITHTMKDWKTKIHLPHAEGCISTPDITFKKGIFQGDSLSPLLFCIALAPITRILQRDNVGYKMSKTKISSLLYMDDLKVYAKNDTEMERSRALIKGFSDDIKMEFGLEKCAVVHMKAGKIIQSTEVRDIPTLTEEESYKYLGILEHDKILHEKAKTKAKKEYTKRVREILKTELNAKNTAQAIRTYAMPVMRYGFGVLKWSNTELSRIDTKVRKMLTKRKFHHPKSNIHRLYMSREKGGRGIIGAVDCHRQECTALAKYIHSRTDELSAIIRECKSNKKGLMEHLEPERAGTTESIDEEHKSKLLKMNLHGNYFKNVADLPNIDMEKSNKWLNIPAL